MWNEQPNRRGSSCYDIINAVNSSLKRLQTDYIDLYQVHVPDLSIPIEETLHTLSHLIRAGKVGYIGCSNFTAWQLVEALWTSRVKNLHSFMTVQSQYNLLARQIEDGLVPFCQANNIGVIPHTLLTGGFLTGEYHQGEELSVDLRLAGQNSAYKHVFTASNWDKLTRLRSFAMERGQTMGELAIAWLLARSWISKVVAGAKRIEQVSANMTAAEWKLTVEEANEVDAMT